MSKQKTSLMTMKIDSPMVVPKSRCYRLPTFPPPKDWPITENVDGTPLSLWGDRFWDWTPYVGTTFRTYFDKNRESSTGGMSKSELSEENEWDLRLVTTVLIFGPHGVTSTSTLKKHFLMLRRLVGLCDNNGIQLRNLRRFPKIIKKIPDVYKSHGERDLMIQILDNLLRSKDMLGFCILDSREIAKLSELFANTISTGSSDDIVQTAYIPPRIYIYIMNRHRECIDDFLEHQEKISDCFQFCLDAYIQKFGSLEAAFDRADEDTSPFAHLGPAGLTKAKRNRGYLGPFIDTAKKFEIDKLLEKWLINGSGVLTMRSLSTYLSLINAVCVPYLGGFTFQRKEELGALRADCLIWEQDVVLGSIPIICGETTKTDPDSDARWPTSPHVAVAIEAATAIAKLRMKCLLKEDGPSDIIATNPPLFFPPIEPWSTSKRYGKLTQHRVRVTSYGSVVRIFPCLYDPEIIKITAEDLEHAKLFTPNLDKKGAFAVGKPWPFSYHQLRRTGGINMFSSELVSETSIQVLLKHLTLLQTRYYGQNFSSSRINQSRQSMVISAAYLVLAKQIRESVKSRYVSPTGKEIEQDKEVNLISEADYQTLRAAAARGEIGFRATALGGCIKRTECQYGGIESIARCAGGDGNKPCSDAKFDSAKRDYINALLVSTELQLQDVQTNSKRHKALSAEITGFKNYLEIISN